jgi:hypothetical protein
MAISGGDSCFQRIPGLMVAWTRRRHFRKHNQVRPLMEGNLRPLWQGF